MPAAGHTPTEFSQPWHHVCRSAGRLLVGSGLIALANAAALLSLQAGAAGVSQFVDRVSVQADREPVLGLRATPPAPRTPGVLSLFGTAPPAPCEDRAPAAVGIRWTRGHPTAQSEAIR